MPAGAASSVTILCFADIAESGCSGEVERDLLATAGAAAGGRCEVRSCEVDETGRWPPGTGRADCLRLTPAAAAVVEGKRDGPATALVPVRESARGSGSCLLSGLLGVALPPTGAVLEWAGEPVPPGERLSFSSSIVISLSGNVPMYLYTASPTIE